ncbi:hypothetical protein FB45DRAFT_1104755 [Roridomyces roridus]|uniref:MYND-type domain-containing protein n=1 Tax=Roridomyces roridus TaxID=1738132 RepID=A0AAD7BDE2_9AGAR|nr:hypothetical protein FB45DRAFT_1104755 [Roridomyces roridus]
MATSKIESLVTVGDDWCFCGHLKEACNDCCADYRMLNNIKMKPWLKQSGWPESEVERIIDDELEAMRRPIMNVSGITTEAAPRSPQNPDGPTYNCHAHSKSDCPICFNFGPFLLQEVQLWSQHLSYLKKARLPAPPSTLTPPGFRFERRFPRQRGFPDISTAASTPSPHDLTFTYPNFRLVNQLPVWDGHTPLGWVLFLTILARRAGPPWSYTARDASGSRILLQFVENWTLIQGGGIPVGKDAERFKDLAPGTLLSFKCVTLAHGAGGEASVAVERKDLGSVKILKGSMADLTTTNNKLRQAIPGSCAQCSKTDAPSSCQSCKSPYCDQECQMKGGFYWKEGGHKKSCGTVAHLRSLNLMFAMPES